MVDFNLKLYLHSYLRQMGQNLYKAQKWCRDTREELVHKWIEVGEKSPIFGEENIYPWKSRIRNSFYSKN